MYKKILVPLDRSKLSEFSLEHVRKVAKLSNEPEVVLLIVLEHVSILTYALSRLHEDEIRKLENKYQNHAQKYIDKVADRLKKEGINAQGEVVYGYPADQIIWYIKEKGVELVIMCTHGRSGIQRWALGSVADKIIRSSTVPVLIIRPQSLRRRLHRKL